MESIIMIIISLLLVPMGIMNLHGNIQSIHWYNRTRITEETRPKYGKLMGISTLIIAGGIFLNGLFALIFENELIYLIGLIPCFFGLVLMLYAQFKYNKGIF